MVKKSYENAKEYYFHMQANFEKEICNTLERKGQTTPTDNMQHHLRTVPLKEEFMWL
jgi:hypothetical protein